MSAPRGKPPINIEGELSSILRNKDAIRAVVQKLRPNTDEAEFEVMYLLSVCSHRDYLTSQARRSD